MLRAHDFNQQRQTPVFPAFRPATSHENLTVRQWNQWLEPLVQSSTVSHRNHTFDAEPPLIAPAAHVTFRVIRLFHLLRQRDRIYDEGERHAPHRHHADHPDRPGCSDRP